MVNEKEKEGLGILIFLSGFFMFILAFLLVPEVVMYFNLHPVWGIVLGMIVSFALLFIGLHLMDM